MEPEVEPKKPLLILNSFRLKYSVLGMLLVFQLTALTQENDAFEKRWEELSEQLEYAPPSRKSSPEDNWLRPDALEEVVEKDPNDEYNEYSSEDIIYSREKRYQKGTDNGVKKHVKKHGSKEIDDLTVPKSEAPKFNPRTRNTDFFEKGDGSITRFVLYSLIIALVVFLIYHFFLKNSFKLGRDSDKEHDLTKDINPKNIQKSQLERDLDLAILNEDYRLALRIYYIMLLKLLIEKEWIQWAKRKTNSHYLLEVSSREKARDFGKAINMYEWVWYGKNHPSKEVFERFQQFYKSFLTRLNEEK